MKRIINKLFDKNSPPILIAEISANHIGSIKNAKKLIYTAKKNFSTGSRIKIEDF